MSTATGRATARRETLTVEVDVELDGFGVQRLGQMKIVPQKATVKVTHGPWGNTVNVSIRGEQDDVPQRYERHGYWQWPHGTRAPDWDSYNTMVGTIDAIPAPILAVLEEAAGIRFADYAPKATA